MRTRRVAPSRPGVRSQGARGLRGSCHRLGGGGEGDEEGVALGIHLYPAVRGEGRPQQRLMLAQRLGVGWAEPLEQVGAALDVGEEEGDGAGSGARPRRWLAGAVPHGRQPPRSAGAGRAWPAPTARRSASSELQGLSQQVQGVVLRGAGQPALQGADRIHADPSAFGQGFLASARPRGGRAAAAC